MSDVSNNRWLYEGQLFSVSELIHKICQSHYVRSTVTRHTHNEDETEEILAETQLRLLRALSENRIRSHHPSSLKVLTCTAALNFLRTDRRKRSRFEPLDNYRSAATPTDEELSDKTLELSAAIEARLGYLPPDLQNVIRCRFMDDRTIDEAAVYLRLPPGTVKSRTFRAIERLQGLVGPIV